jgi:hypothetical protein
VVHDLIQSVRVPVAAPGESAESSVLRCFFFPLCPHKMAHCHCKSYNSPCLYIRNKYHDDLPSLEELNKLKHARRKEEKRLRMKRKREAA